MNITLHKYICETSSYKWNVRVTGYMHSKSDRYCQKALINNVLVHTPTRNVCEFLDQWFSFRSVFSKVQVVTHY